MGTVRTLIIMMIIMGLLWHPAVAQDENWFSQSMEKLEKITEAYEPVSESIRNEQIYAKAKMQKPAYKGLTLVEESQLSGPTGIRYWM